LDYTVKKKGGNDQTRMARLLKFRGPDDDTLAVLENNIDGWMDSPESFWTRPPTRVMGLMNPPPQEEIVSLFIQTKRDDA
jgi:hypothetical protein